ncbi:hypothetical protein B5807_07810 [Epicoccum nigrum]|uniref:Rhodopsin domain-containing protein n=1 Tax=Epicoccum nigrum TaxID=105696 RepID=A0A1Y2LYV7_EPING|nr:hypothetical protein B5807_07810 [Epicoccum nigrum]
MTPIELLSLLHECSTAAASDPTSINPACPALAPPPGELPLKPNAASLWSHSVGMLTACCALVCLSMVLRMFTRTFIVKKKFALEDALIVFAAVLFIPIVGLQINAYNYGGSKHQWNVTIGDLSTALRYVYAVLILYCFSLYAAKLSILLQIKHIFLGTPQVKKFVFWASWAMIALVTCAYIFTTMLLIFSCTPVQKAWNPLLPGKCHNSAAGYVSGTVNLVSDVAVLLLPMAGVSQLRMELRKKAAVSAIFSTGLV